MRNFRTAIVVAALAAVALLVPATAQAATVSDSGSTVSASTNAWGWRL